MIEDKLLIWKFRRGSSEALRRIYEKYEGYLLTLATALLNDVHTAEDVVHDCFVSFAQSAGRLRVDGRLKGYATWAEEHSIVAKAPGYKPQRKGLTGLFHTESGKKAIMDFALERD